MIKDLPDNKSPSIGVAVFDGINQYGIPYNESSEYTGLADTLSSNFINLESFSSKDSIYLSFLWKINNFYPNYSFDLFAFVFILFKEI